LEQVLGSQQVASTQSWSQTAGWISEGSVTETEVDGTVGSCSLAVPQAHREINVTKAKQIAANRLIKTSPFSKIKTQKTSNLST
jgi:hypothetical protein